MSWLEIVWCFFWRSLAWRQHERPLAGDVPPLPEPAQRGEAAWKWATVGFRHFYRRPLTMGAC